MDSLKDFLASITGTLRDRFGNPLLGAYALAWCLWNFRILLVLLGDGEGGWPAKLDYLNDQLLAQWWVFPYFGLVGPLVIAIFWTLAMPPVLRFFAVRHQKETTKTRNQVLKETNELLVTQAEASDIRDRMRKDLERWGEERRQLQKVIDDLRLAVERAESSSAATRSELDTLPNEKAMPGGVGRNEDEGVLLKNLEDQLDANERRLATPSVGALTATAQQIEANAQRLGLTILARSESASLKAEVLFHGYQISWPWAMSQAAKELSETVKHQGAATTLDETTIAILISIRDIDPPNGSDALNIDFIAQGLNWDKFNVKAGFDRLRQLSFVDPLDRTINSNGRLFVAWLIREGFELKIPKIDGSKLIYKSPITRASRY